MILQYWIKYALAPLIYRKPVTGLAPERLYAYMDALWSRRKLDGPVLEVGCYIAGTAAIAYKMLSRTGYEKRYICIDTFEGFLSEQFNHEMKHGTPKIFRKKFSSNSVKHVRRLLKYWDCNEIELVKGDIVTIKHDALPENISVCLLDVDLDIPIYEGLKKIYPKIVSGGIILVDDCPENYSWAGARIGYKRFVDENNIPENYFVGMGIITK